MWNPLDFIFHSLLDGLFDLLPRPVQIGCLTIGGLGLLGLILWLWLK